MDPLSRSQDSDQKLTSRQHQYKIDKIPYYTVYNMGTAHKEGDFCSTFFKNEDFYGGRFFGRVRATYIDAPILYSIRLILQHKDVSILKFYSCLSTVKSFIQSARPGETILTVPNSIE